MRLVLLAAFAAGAIVIAVAGYSGYWFIAAGEIGDRIDEWAEKQRAEGLEIESTGTEVAGFPTRFEVTLREPRIHDTRNGWRWAAQSLRAEASAWDFSEVTVFPERRNSVQVLVEGGEWRDIEAAFAGGQLVVKLDDERQFKEIRLDLQGLEIAGIWPDGLARVGTLQANGVALEDEAIGEEVLKTSIAVRDAVLPSDLARGARRDPRLPRHRRERGGLDPERARHQRGDHRLARRRPARWSSRAFACGWGPLGVETSGTIALDGAMRPIAALTADIIGYGDVIDALIMSNLIPLGDGFIAKVAFNMLAEKPEDGSAPVLRGVPVTAQDGTLTVATIKLAELPPLPLE